MGKDRLRRISVSAFCSGVLATCVLVNLGLHGPRAASAAVPSVTIPHAPEPAAAVPLVSPTPEGEETTVVRPGDGVRHRRHLARAVIAWYRPLVASALRAHRKQAAAPPASPLPVEFEVYHEPLGARAPSEPSTTPALPVLDAGATSRFAASFLRTTARYRYAPTPTVTVDSDSDTVLLGLTWRR